MTRDEILALAERLEHNSTLPIPSVLACRDAAAALRQLADEASSLLAANILLKRELSTLRERFDACCEQVTASVNRERALREELAELEHTVHVLREERDQIASQIVSGFYEERTPLFQQGRPTHELQSVVTAEEVTAYVKKIDELTKERDREERLLQAGWELDTVGDEGGTPCYRWWTVKTDEYIEREYMHPDRAEAARLAEAKMGEGE